MKIYKASAFRMVIAILAGSMLLVALACDSDTAMPTTTVVQTADPTPVPEGLEMSLESPGYDPAWGQPVRGGTFTFGTYLASKNFYPLSQSGCYFHGCAKGLPWNTLFRIDAWQGDLSAVEGDLVESWNMSGDGVTLTMKLHEGVKFFDADAMPADSTLPAEFNGGQILGDEFVCEDAKATYERLYISTPEFLIPFSGGDRSFLEHLNSVTCPDGPRGYTFVMHFERPMAKTMGILSGRAASILDKDYVAWLDAYGDENDVPFGRAEVPANFYAMHGTGPFVPEEINLNIGTTFIANPDYWKEGLPLLDRFENIVIKDPTARFAALATGKIHYYGEGSSSLAPGQAEQAIRDFSDRIVINNQLNHWARTLFFGANEPWDDLRVRRAIHLALDRDEWLEFNRISGYEGMRLAHTMAPGTFYAPTEEEIRTWPGYRQPKDVDIAEANRLMDEVFGAGIRPNATCMAVATSQTDTDACEFVIDQLNKNLNMTVTTDFNESVVNRDRTRSGNFDFNIGSYTESAIGDPDDDLFNNYIPEFVNVFSQAFMDARWAEQPEVMAEVESLIRAQSAELDRLVRKDLVRELDLKILNEVSQYVNVGWNMIFPGWREELKGWRGYDLYSYTKYTMHERMWLAR